MTLITSVLDWLALLTEPFWLTLYALAEVIGQAGAGTALFAAFLLVVSLDFLRSSKDALIPVARALSIASSLFFVASFVYGDFLAAPAKAAFSAVVARSEVLPPKVVALTTLSAAGAGMFFLAARRQSTVHAISAPPKATYAYAAAARRDLAVASLGRSFALDAAGRLQLRQMSRNSKKSVNAVRPAMRAMAPVAIAARNGRRATRFERV